MPLPTDPQILKLGSQLLEQFDTFFGVHPGFRPAHAKGLLLSGTFTPAPEAPALTRAAHIGRPSTPVTARFSNATGLPTIPDSDPNANPRGLAIRFNLGEHVHTDIVSHSADGFPTHTGEEFLEFLRALSTNTVADFLSSHPAALSFVQNAPPSPASFATEPYFAVTAFRFINARGVSRYGRYRITPQADVQVLDEETAKGKDANYLFDELRQRIQLRPVAFDIAVQVAADGDVVDNATVRWPANRPLIPFGSVVLIAEVPDNAREQQHIIYDPIPRTDGIEASADPLFEIRAALYLMSGRRRRAAETQASGV
jgi:catalase